MFHPTTTVATLKAIPSGPRGIADTLKEMVQLVKAGKKNMDVRETTGFLVNGCLQKDSSCEIQTIHAFVRDQIRYLQDISDVETITTPEKTLELGYGDCDDKCILIASMLESIGYKTRFVAIGFQPGVFAHVYCEVKLGNNTWFPLETTEDVAAGWEPPPRLVMAKMVYYN